jgi:cytidylate kinase
MAKITIFGWVGTGKTSVGKELAKRFNYDFISSGNIFRAEAESLGIGMHELEELYNQDPERDKNLDNKMAEYGQTHNNFIADSRLAWHFIPDSIKIKLVAETDERARRVAEREGISLAAAKHDITFREDVCQKRYQEVYGLTTIAPDNLFDLIIDTTQLNFTEVVDKVEAFLKPKI